MCRDYADRENASRRPEPLQEVSLGARLPLSDRILITTPSLAHISPNTVRLMAGFGGIGPSTGRLVEVCESSEARLERARYLPPVIWALSFAALFLGVLAGTTLIHLGEELLGVILLIAPVAFVVSLVLFKRR
jgi:hypothetical protein